MGRFFYKFCAGILFVAWMSPIGVRAQGIEIVNPTGNPDRVFTVKPVDTQDLQVFRLPNLQRIECNLAPVPPPVQRLDLKEQFKDTTVGMWNVFEQFKREREGNGSNSGGSGIQVQNPRLGWLVEAKRLDNRLKHCAILRDQIIWQEPDGTKIPYESWPEEKKSRLNQFFQRLDANEASLGIQCPVASRALVSPHYLFYYDYVEAFDVFAAHVAHVLFLEAKNLVPWKVYRMPSEEVAQLLDSENYFSIIKPSAKTDYPSHIAAGEDYQPLGWTQSYGPMLCDPRYAFHAFSQLAYNGPQFPESVVGPDMESTLANLSVWFRNFVHHGSQTFSSLPETFVESYMTVASRFLLKEYDGKRRIVAFDGCHQAAGLMREIARSLNIPLLLVAAQDSPSRPGIPFPSRVHKGLCFRWSSPEGRCLWHLDEIYANQSDEPTFPIDAQGQSMDAAAANLDFFRTHWVKMSELPQWGFEMVMADTIPSAQDGDLFFSTKGAEEEYENYGTFLGYWHLSDRAQALWDQDGGQTPRLEYLDLSRYMRFVHLIQTASFYLLQDPCEDIPQIRNVDLGVHMQGLRAAQPPPVTFTISELEQKMQNVVQAYGDTWGNCSHIRAIQQDFMAKRDSL